MTTATLTLKSGWAALAALAASPIVFSVAGIVGAAGLISQYNELIQGREDLAKRVQENLNPTKEKEKASLPYRVSQDKEVHLFC